MKIDRLGLIEALKAVSPGLAQKEVIEQSTSFVFTEDGTVVTYNDEIAISYPIAVNFTGAVPAKEFFNLISRMSVEEIEISIEDGFLLVKGSRAKSGLRLESEISLPFIDLAQPEEDAWKKLPKSFCEAVKFCLFTVSKDQTKAVLTCLHINGQYIESTENHRITRYDIGANKVFKKPFLFPAHAARSIINNKPQHFAITDGWLHFKNEAGLQFSCRTFEEDFPDVMPVLDTKGHAVKFPSAINEIMDRANVISNGERVVVDIADNKLTISSEGDNGWFKESIRIAYDKEAVEFEIAPEFMKSIMRITDTAELCKNVLKFTGENFVHVVGIIKPKAKEVKKGKGK